MSDDDAPMIDREERDHGQEGEPAEGTPAGEPVEGDETVEETARPAGRNGGSGDGNAREEDSTDTGDDRHGGAGGESSEDAGWWERSALAQELRTRSSRLAAIRAGRPAPEDDEAPGPDEIPGEEGLAASGAIPVRGFHELPATASDAVEEELERDGGKPESPAGSPAGDGGAGASADVATEPGNEGDGDRAAAVPEAAPPPAAAAPDRETAGEGQPPEERPSGASTTPSPPPRVRSTVVARRPAGSRHRAVTPAADGASKLGIVGGKGVGKSYLFQSMVFRTYSGVHSGALTYYLEKDGTQLFSALDPQRGFQQENIGTFVDNYAAWRRLDTTLGDHQKWYRLRLNYRAGVLGRRRDSLDVEFFDASGELFFERAMDPQNEPLWRGYADARVMVFCLPLWAAFPRGGLPAEDQQRRFDHLQGFEKVVDHYRLLRQKLGRTHPVRSVLALTMADDPRGALETLRSRWVMPYMDAPGRILRSLRTGPGAARYLANARRISDALHRELEEARSPGVSRIPGILDFDGGRPWVVPLSAIEGSRLDLVEELEEERPPHLDPPVPVHAELPLLVALCERTNALM